MSKYRVTIDGFYIGVVDLTPAEVVALLSDNDIRIEKI